MKFVDPKNDIAFRKIFGDENKTETLISFLNAVLKLEGDDRIQSVKIISPFQLPRIKDLKESILDVRATDKLKREFIIEMQVESKPYMDKRVLYYTSKSYIAQIKRADQYPKLKPIIFIGILDFKMFDGKNYLSKYLIKNAETNTHEFKDFELNFVELKKFNKKEDELKTVIDKWIYFIKNGENLNTIPKNIKDKGLKQAYKTANEYSWTEKELEVYDYAGMLKTDRKGELQFAKEQGIEQGIEKERRVQEDRRKRDKLETANKMKKNGIPADLIAEITGLTKEEIEKS